MNPLVSVVIPVYNRKKFIAEAVGSALDQDCLSFEVVISDNCSDDGTWEECVRLYGNNPRVVLLRNPTNLGPVPNWLAAATAARGDYVKFLFSDDVLLQGCLFTLSKYLADDVGFVYCGCLVGESLLASSNSYSPPLFFKRNVGVLPSWSGLMMYAMSAGTCVPVSPCAAMFRKNDVVRSLQNSLQSPAAAEALLTGAGPDVNLYLDALNIYPKFAVVHRPLVFFRSHSSSFSTGPHRLSVLRGYKATLLAFYLKQPFFYRFILRIKLLFAPVKQRIICCLYERVLLGFTQGLRRLLE